ncbi:uncharacterized protein BCR38DRAFT_512710 [Pseudomassariella vexata]|uniref:Uncharacterized protein n=1 Tax=Pseudomassariella vexata TaxID=1141098 RepID=A0A1Y2E4Q2_9PEZI|nr:uncharacterized protein BCR38DRAFT_512710 [Pseudomassariella vexata]ORY66538.1 hypothetical protein BCR38DRAFT_512710 [Pseudomassariella vexata]
MDPYAGDSKTNIRLTGKRGVFFFGNYQSGRAHNWLQYLACPYITTTPSALHASHWFFSVEKLGLVLNKRVHPGLGHFDRTTVARNTSLKVIYLVIPLATFTGPSDQDKKAVYAEYDSYIRDYKRRNGHIPSFFAGIPGTEVAQMKQDLVDIFKDGDSPVEAKVVVEISSRRGKGRGELVSLDRDSPAQDPGR